MNNEIKPSPIHANNNAIIAQIEAHMKSIKDEIEATDNPLTKERLHNKIAGMYDAIFIIQDNTLEHIKSGSEVGNV